MPASVRNSRRDTVACHTSIDLHNPPRHPDHGGGCTPLMRIFMCITCAGGCMLCGGIFATATLAPFALSDTNARSLARSQSPRAKFSQNVRDSMVSVEELVESWIEDMRSSPPTAPANVHDSIQRIRKASNAFDRETLMHMVPEWFRPNDKSIDLSRALIDLASALNHTL